MVEKTGPDGLRPRLSVVVPCFNERATIQAVLGRVRAADTIGMALEIIVVDDGLTDCSPRIVTAYWIARYSIFG